MKKTAIAICICVGLSLGLTACQLQPEEKEIQAGIPASQEDPLYVGESGYSDGIYRGFFYEQDIEQISVQFELKDGIFTEVTLRSIKYKDGNYLSSGATDIQKQIARQYKQAASYLIGKGTEAVVDLDDSTAVAEDMDAVTSATLNTDKLADAVNDGLQRNVFSLLPTSQVKVLEECEDGFYSGVYNDGGVEQIAVDFEVRDNRFITVQYRSLNYGDKNFLEADSGAVSGQIAQQYRQAADYLEGKPISVLKDLYSPGELLKDMDAVTGATLKTNKLISAINDGFHNGARPEK